MKTKHAFLLIATLEIEHFWRILVEEYATIHLIDCHLLFFDLFPSNWEIILFLEDGKIWSCFYGWIFSKRNKAICCMLHILFFLERGLIEKSAQLCYLWVNMKFWDIGWMIAVQKLMIFCFGQGGRGLVFLRTERWGFMYWVPKDGFYIHKN